ncbi:MAG: AlpA family transcriptional regulator [Bacilli bacterium]
MKKLRLTKKEVCYMLSIKQDKLIKLINNDEKFPRPVKDGTNRQSAVYFDAKAVELWWYNKTNQSITQ